MILTIDFEIRSEVSIQDAGAWKYASHPSTTPVCLAVKEDDKPAVVWLPDWVARILMQHKSDIEFSIECKDDITLAREELAEVCRVLGYVISTEDLMGLVRVADIIEAHNAEFERACWHHLMPGELPVEKVHCTAARAVMAALPRDLARVCQVLKLPTQKDMEGNKVMKKVCMPRRTKDGTLTFSNDPKDILETIRYCIQDVEAEHAASKVLPQLPPGEREVWLFDQKVNGRGIRVDRPACEAIIAMVEKHKTVLLEEFRGLTGGAPESPTQVAKFIEWCRATGCNIDNMQAEIVDAEIKALPVGHPVRRALQIRRAVGKTSTAKYEAMLDRIQDDSRCRSLFMYHGAGTGRWSGNGLQPQNLPSRKIYKDPEGAIDLILSGASPSLVDCIIGDPMWVASSCIRSVITAEPGSLLYVGDYKSIEGRVLAWLAGEQYVLDAYHAGADMYKIAAAGIYHRKPEEIPDHSPERQVGKVCELALGYQGGIGALSRMAANYGIELPPPEETQEIIRNWRASRPQTVRFWKELDTAAKMSIRNPGQIVDCGRVRFKTAGGRLMMRLPSGRCLYYHNPSIGVRKAPWLKDDGTAAETEAILFWGIDSTTKQWCQQSTYGGCLAENATQAVARDLLVHGMLTVAASGKYQIVLHVHDEAVAESSCGDLDEYLKLLATLPDWAAGIPLVAEGHVSFRYKKG